jgi:hypothetical protein
VAERARCAAFTPRDLIEPDLAAPALFVGPNFAALRFASALPPKALVSGLGVDFVWSKLGAPPLDSPSA